MSILLDLPSQPPRGVGVSLAGDESWPLDGQQEKLPGFVGGVIGRLNNGAGYALLPLRERTTAVVAVVVGAGARHEEGNEKGVAHLVEHVLFKGKKRWQLLEGFGGGADGETDKELTLFVFRVPAGEVELALRVASETICRPSFLGTEVEKEKRVVIDEIKMVNDSTISSAYMAFDKAMWPDSPLGQMTGGTPDEVAQLTVLACQQFYRRAYCGANLQVVVAGAFDAQMVTGRLEAAFGSLPRGERLMAPALAYGVGHRAISVTQSVEQEVAIMARGTSPPIVSVTRGGEQAVAVVGGQVGGYLKGWRPAAQLLTVILGRGLSSRWHQELRERRAIVYDVHSLLVQHRETGFLAGVASCDPKNLPEVIEALEGEMYDIAGQGVSATELELAKSYQKGQFLMGQDDTAAIAGAAAVQMSLEGEIRSVETEVLAWEAVTEEEIQALAAGIVGRGLRLALAGAVAG